MQISKLIITILEKSADIILAHSETKALAAAVASST
jgi:hypothetical protein|tara:strand:- start:5302 stop:5409 length:108 start_codon:yes stop_codon:yes gene_type:complete